MKISISFFLSFFLSVCFSQNLIPNGSFERSLRVNSLNYHGDIGDSVESWHSIGTADIFSLSVEGETYAFNNLFGFQIPSSGKCYAGIFMGKKGASANELIWTYLDSTLIKDSTYCISFKYSLADYSELAIKEIGVSFSQFEAYKMNQRDFGTLWEEVIKLKPIKLDTSREKLNNTKTWSEFRYLFNAKGNEKIIYIGCFPEKITSDFTIPYTRDTIPIPDIWIDYSYYYIDDVSLTKASGNDCLSTENNFYNKILFDTLTFEINDYKVKGNFSTKLKDLCKCLKQ